MQSTPTNPFSEGDPDRRAIWEMLVVRDTECFLNADWAGVDGDFVEDAFHGLRGADNPDHWTSEFPNLGAYRDTWLAAAARYSSLNFVDTDLRGLLYAATLLRDIEIAGDRAVAHKKFDGRATTDTGQEIILNWQTLYFLRRVSGRWRITGFVGFLPNPMPSERLRPAASVEPRIARPEAVTQHKTAGPYSPALRIAGGPIVALSGQGPIDLDGNVCGATIEEQTEHTIENCQRLLEQSGAGLRDVFKVTVYLSDMGQWEAFNRVYRRYFTPPEPARTAIQAVLWGGIQVEIDLLAAPSK